MQERSGPFWDAVQGRAPMPPAAATLGFQLIDADVRPGLAWALAAGAVAALATVLTPWPRAPWPRWPRSLPPLAVAARPGSPPPGRPTGRVADPHRLRGRARRRSRPAPARASPGRPGRRRPARRSAPRPGLCEDRRAVGGGHADPDHYVVDVDLAGPAVPGGGWALRVDGAVTRPLRLSLADLRAMPTIERW